MPFGIPQSDARTHAVDDFCGATTEQLESLIAEVIAPICDHAAAYETAIDAHTKDVTKAMSQHAKGMARRLTTIAAEPEQTLGPMAEQLESYITSRYGEVSEQPVSLETQPPHSPPPPAPPPESNGATKGACTDLTPDDVARIRAALAADPTSLSDAELSSVFNCAPPFTVTDRRAALAAAQTRLGPTPGVQQALLTKPPPPPPPPKPPTMYGGFPCPQLPEGYTSAGGIVGTPEWCAHAERVLSVLEQLGGQIVQWVERNAAPEEWAAIPLWDHLDESNASWGWAAKLLNQLQDLLRTVLRWAGKVALWAIDAVRCITYYSTALTPVRRPQAYVSLLILRNTVAWIRDSRIGSQSYLGVTLGLSLTLPQLEAYIGHLLDYLSPVELPGIPEVAEAYLAGYIPRPQYECLLQLQGMSPDLFEPFIQSRGERLRSEEVIQYARRVGLSQDKTLDLMRRAGWYDSKVAESRIYLYDELPSVADHLHWMQRNVFDAEYVKDYQLDAGFEERFWKTFGHDLQAQGYTHDRARYEYMAHWIQPSPQQMLEFVYRLRPGRDPKGTVFTLQDYERILVEQDYSPLSRQWFAATAYKVPALSYLRDMHRMGILSDASMREYHADLGYTQEDSERFVQVDSYRRQRMRASQGSGWSPAALRKAYAIGQIDHATVESKMTGMGFQPQDVADLEARAKSDLQYRVLSRSYSQQLTTTIRQVREAVRVGIMDEDSGTTALTDLGWDAARAHGIVQMEIASARTGRIKAAIQRVRHAYTAGEIDGIAAKQSLESLGLTSEAIADYVAIWTIEMTPGRKRRTAQEIVKDVAEHMMDATEAQARLANLGYTQADILLFLADAGRQTVETQEALQYLQTLGGKEQGQALTELGEHTVGLSKRIVAQLKQQQPPGKLAKWLKLRLLSATQVRARLRLYGWAEDAIELWIAEVEGGHAEGEEEP